jgi:hypothetical protein
MNRPRFVLGLIVLLGAAGLARGEGLSRPDWMDEPGLVMAGNWEEPSFRARRMGRLDYTLPPDKIEQYNRERTPEMIAKLKELGVNFLMIHCYKGAGFKTEHVGMEDARQFAALAHRSGMRVGTYIGGTMLYERLYQELPEARNWQAFGPHGEAVYYTPAQQFRYAVVKHHPGFIEYLKRPVRFAIEEVHADLIHFDNFGSGTNTYDAYTRQRFREYLGGQGKSPADPPAKNDPADPLVRDWTEFKCRMLAEHYAAMSQFIRGLNPQCGVECNPGALGGGAGAPRGVDHARLIPLGNAFCDEDFGAQWNEQQGSMRTRIRSLKAGQLFNNSLFLYCESALDLAESMAFNVNCLGYVTWYEWGKMETAHLSEKPLPPEMKTYIRFFLDHQDLYGHAPSVADVAVLRTFAQQSFGPRPYMGVEQALIQSCVPWRMIFDAQLDQLGAYRVVVAPDDSWLTERQRRQLADFAARGGLVLHSAKIEKDRDFPRTLRPRLRVVAEAPPSVTLELCQQRRPQRVLLHLVNYNTQQTVRGIDVLVRPGTGKPQTARLLSPDPAAEQTLKVRSEPDGLHLTVPELKIYAVVVLEGLGL